jgi:hypothetical protein
MTGAPPRVFISYSHDTVEHQERVLSLADRLRADGIDAEFDQYNAAPPEGWPLWCERQIASADVVLMVCTETYYRRVSGDEERGKGLGVVWEARIIRQLPTMPVRSATSSCRSFSLIPRLSTSRSQSGLGPYTSSIPIMATRISISA